MVRLLPKACKQRCGVVLVLDQVGRRAVVHTAVQRDNARCHAVYRAEFQLPGQCIPKPRGETGTHFPRGGHGVGHCQNRLRWDAADQRHVSQPGNQHRGLAAARHGQQQHRAVHSLHRRPLLRVQRRHMGRCKFGFVHGSSFRQIVNIFRMAACIVGGRRPRRPAEVSGPCTDVEIISYFPSKSKTPPPNGRGEGCSNHARFSAISLMTSPALYPLSTVKLRVRQS